MQDQTVARQMQDQTVARQMQDQTVARQRLKTKLNALASMPNRPKVLFRGLLNYYRVREARLSIFRKNQEIMNAPATTDRAAVTVVEISDPTDANAGIELIDLDAVQLQSVPFRARRVVVRVGTATVLFTSTNLRMRTRTRVCEGYVAYATYGPQSRGTVNGLAVRPGLMIAAEPEAEARSVVDAGWESILILLPPQDIRDHLAARQREGEFRLPAGVEMLETSPAASRRLLNN